ncbi:hypothetical protein PanWU01x14_074260, partial [Parasponia andersonii]
VSSPSPTSISSCWSPPPFGELKLNVDIAVDEVHGASGLGLIIRDLLAMFEVLLLLELSLTSHLI